MSQCADPTKCGRPQQGQGHPKKGWIKTHVAGQRGSDAWWCSATCLVVDLTQSGRVERPDVARCPLCVNRHDRGHRCPICNTAPQLIAPRPTPATRLYDNARRGMDLLRKDPA